MPINRYCARCPDKSGFPGLIPITSGFDHLTPEGKCKPAKEGTVG